MTVWNCLHIFTACIYTVLGLLQAIAGFFFLTSMNMVKLSTNLWVGTLDIIIGISGGILACSCEISAARQRTLLCMSVSILLVNTVNTILSEWFFLTSPSFNEFFASKRHGSYSTYVRYVRLITELSGVLLIIISFFDAQLIFLSYLALHKRNRRKKRLAASAQKQKPVVKRCESYDPDSDYVIRTKNEKATTTNLQGTQTNINWVYKNPGDLRDEATSTSSPKNLVREKSPIYQENHITPMSSAATTINYLKTTPNTGTLSTFSRTPSPTILSKTQSQSSLHEKNTIEFIEKKRKDNDPYSNLMLELEKAFANRKNSKQLIGPEQLVATTNSNESLQSSNSSKNSDRKFSKELEAALKSIQDLESPQNDEDEYGLKNSGTTSGYNSPTPPNNSNSNANNLNYSITTNPQNNSTIISLHTKPELKTFKTITEIKSDSEKMPQQINSVDSISTKNGSVGKKNLIKSFLYKKRKPFSLPELEDSIIKSESLAFLTHEQLLERVKQNTVLRRKIQQKVQQQLGHTVSESNC